MKRGVYIIRIEMSLLQNS